MTKPAKEVKLTEKQRRFVEAYMGEAAGNATEAARLAGYKGAYKTLAAMGAENLEKPGIKAAIEEIQEKDPLIASRDDRQKFWTSIMYSDGEDTKNRLRASELLAKSGGDFIERRKVEHGGRVEVDSGPGHDLLQKISQDPKLLGQIKKVVDGEGKDG